MNDDMTCGDVWWNDVYIYRGALYIYVNIRIYIYIYGVYISFGAFFLPTHIGKCVCLSKN